MNGFTRRPLGKTGLQVSPLGIGGGGCISSSDLLYAFEQGINYFFYSTDLHHTAYEQSRDAIRQLCGHGSTVREQVVLATVSYVNHPKKLTGVLCDLLMDLGLDYIDVFHWGWITESEDMLSLIKGARAVQRNVQAVQFIREIQQIWQSTEQQMEEVNQELVQRGLVRHVGASFHSRRQARAWMRNLDVLMLRYNIAHLGAESEIVPHLYQDKARDPGIVVFNTAHQNRALFSQPPVGYRAGEYLPTTPDCYRFALTQEWVDLVLTGPRNRHEVDEALKALEQGPMSEEECTLMRKYGERCREEVGSKR